MRVRAILSLLTALSLPAAANELSDPTRPPTVWQAKRADPALAPMGIQVGPRLTSILTSPSRRIAVIDGMSLHEGQTANGLTVVHIGKTWVDARVGGAPLRLSLSDAKVTKEPR